MRILLALTLVVSVAGSARATTLYVRTSGLDSNDGLTPATALHSIRTAARLLSDTGGEIIVGPGTYMEGDISRRTSSLSSPRVAPLLYTADASGSQTGDPAGPVFVDATGHETGFLVYGESNVTINGFHVGGALDAAIQVRYNRGSGIASENVTVANCIVFSNIKRGIDVRDTRSAMLVNNISYANGTTGIVVGGNIVGSADALIAQNTVFGNGVYGIEIGAGDSSPVASPNALVVSNVIANNVVAGIKVEPASQPTYGAAYNVSADPFQPRHIQDVADLWTDPLLVDPAGADGILGGTGFADDDFHLDPASPAVDYGPADITTVGLTGGTQDDGSPDVGIVDAGYHFDNSGVSYAIPPIPQSPIFVRLAGNDANDGRTPEQALRTIRRAASLALPGNRIVVGGGTYQEGDVNLGDLSGTRYRRIGFVGDTDGVWTGDAGPVVVDAAGSFQTGFDILGSSYVTVDGFYITGGTDSGIQIRARPGKDGLRPSDYVTISNCIVFSNVKSGILVRDSANPTIYNNLVYANGTAGIAVGGDHLGSPNAQVVHNTVYGNGANGITIGDNVNQDTIGSPGAIVVGNLLDQNWRHSLFVSPASLAGYVAAANMDSAVVGPLGFVAPAGADGILGYGGFADDDFHLEQVAAGQSTTSIAVDAGVAAATSMGLAQGTTRTDSVADDGMADLGFHYGLGGGVRPAPVDVRPLLVGMAAVAPLRTLFVTNDGNDAQDGMSPASAFATMRAAAQAAVPGDQIVVAPGLYAEGDIHLNNSGTVNRPIAFVADTTGKLSGSVPGPVIIDAQGKYDTGFVLLNRSFVAIRGFHVTRTRQAGIQLRACAAGDGACKVTSGSDHVSILDNVIFSGRRGIQIEDSTDATIFNNLVYANTSTGISIKGSQRTASNTRVINNTLYRNGAYGILLGRDRGATGAVLANNIVRASAFSDLTAFEESTPGLVLTHNNLKRARGVPPDPSGIVGAPGFVDPMGTDRVLGGYGFADDDFHIDVRRPSVVIDTGALAATDLGLSSMVVLSDGAQDSGPVDLGFHYGIPGPLEGVATPITTLFVRAAAGNDANDGRTAQTALRSIRAAAAQAGAGTTIVIGPGVYHEGNIRPFGKGTLTNPIRFVAEPSGLRTADRPGVILIDATGFNTGLYLARQSYVRLEGLNITGARFAAITDVDGTGTEIVNCRLFSNAGAGIILMRPRDANTVFNNLIYANGGHGVRARVGSVRHGHPTLRVVNNTLYGNAAGGVQIEGTNDRGCRASLLVANNLIQNNAVDLSVSPPNLCRTRLLSNALSQPLAAFQGDTAGSLAVSALFRTPAGLDGVLGGSGFADDDFRVDGTSGVIDAGVGTAALWGLNWRTLRRDGVRDRGPVDIGYHYP